MEQSNSVANARPLSMSPERGTHLNDLTGKIGILSVEPVTIQQSVYSASTRGIVLTHASGVSYLLPKQMKVRSRPQKDPVLRKFQRVKAKEGEGMPESSPI